MKTVGKSVAPASTFLSTGRRQSITDGLEILEILYSLWCEQNGLELVSIEEVKKHEDQDEKKIRDDAV